MTASALPVPYIEWRECDADRAEDAAYTFGHDLIVHCRDEALATLSADASEETKTAVEHAVDLALHNVMDLLEGFWPLPTGPSHSVEYALQVRVHDGANNLVETQEVSPCRLDLPIGYWKWARDREFR